MRNSDLIQKVAIASFISNLNQGTPGCHKWASPSKSWVCFHAWTQDSRVSPTSTWGSASAPHVVTVKRTAGIDARSKNPKCPQSISVASSFCFEIKSSEKWYALSLLGRERLWSRLQSRRIPHFRSMIHWRIVNKCKKKSEGCIMIFVQNIVQPYRLRVCACVCVYRIVLRKPNASHWTV